MKISIIGPSYPFRGGISHYTTLLYRHLKKRHEGHFFAFKRQYPKWLFPGNTDKDNSSNPIREEGVENILDSLNPLTWCQVFLRIKRENPTLVIFPWWVSFWTPQFWTIATLIKMFTLARILFICHNVVEHESKWIDKILTRFVLKMGDFFIVHSAEDQQNLLSIFPEANVQISFHPTYDVFDFGDFDPDTMRKKYRIDGNIILFFGFIREYKGLKYLIRALPEVLSKVQVTLFVVGEFWKDKDEYIRLIKEVKIENNIILVDEYVPNEDVGYYFSAADLVAQPYTSATGSGVIQIAFGFNKPVIATEVGCLPEVVEDGKTGYLVPPESTHELAEAIIKFFEDGNVEDFSKNVRKENYKFSWEFLVKRIEELVI